jgi:hypothetical protein
MHDTLSLFHSFTFLCFLSFGEGAHMLILFLAGYLSSIRLFFHARSSTRIFFLARHLSSLCAHMHRWVSWRGAVGSHDAWPLAGAQPVEEPVGHPSHWRSRLERSPSAVCSAPDLRFPSCLLGSSPRWVLCVARDNGLGKLMRSDSIPILPVHPLCSSDSFPGVHDGVDPAVGASTTTSSPSAGKSSVASDSGGHPR